MKRAPIVASPEALVLFSSEAVSDVDLLMALVYTGTDVQGNLRWWLRQDIDKYPGKWGRCAHALSRCVGRLEEEPPRWLYHGLNGVKVPEGAEHHGTYDNFISLSTSYEVAAAFAKGHMGTAGPVPGEVATVLCFDVRTFWEPHICKHGPAKGACHKVFRLADMQWLSKFPAEKEWLMTPGNKQGNGPYMKFKPLAKVDGIFRWHVWYDGQAFLNDWYPV